ncbi:Anp1-domain-containing protein [Cunninghamella echinulata]|nr:Anp1-domain-containing protein [Cunninghamella echinulata]
MSNDKVKRRSVSILSTIQNKNTLSIIIGIVFIFSLLIYQFNGTCVENNIATYDNNGNIIDSVQQLSQTPLKTITFTNLNDLNGPSQVVIMSILPPWAIDGNTLDIFFKQLAQQTHKQTRVALLVVNPPSPTTIYTVRQYIEKAHLHFPIALYTKTFEPFQDLLLNPDDESNQKAIYELEPLRRSLLARTRNYLLQSSLMTSDKYVLWLDPLLQEFPKTLIEDFIYIVEGKNNNHNDHSSSSTIDILVPNTMIQKNGRDWGYDRSNWQETEMSKAIQETVAEDFIFMEGWWEFETRRFLLIDMMDTEDDIVKKVDDDKKKKKIKDNQHLFKKVPLDGVGSTCLFVKAEIHQSGINFPPYPYQHQLDSEAFAKAAQSEGYHIYGLPNYKIYRLNEDDEGEFDDSNSNGRLNHNNHDNIFNES